MSVAARFAWNPELHPRGADGRFGDSVTSLAHDALDKSSLPESQREFFKKCLKQALASMPETAHELIKQNTRGFQFYENADKLTTGLLSTNPADTPKEATKRAEFLERIRSGQEAGAAGAYDTATGVLHLNGDAPKQSFFPKLWGKKPDDSVLETERYTHEFMHAVDGPKMTISSSSAWISAWAQEIQATGGISPYAGTATYEGFAEFGRALYARQHSAKEIEKLFPKCSKVFKDNGLWPI